MRVRLTLNKQTPAHLPPVFPPVVGLFPSVVGGLFPGVVGGLFPGVVGGLGGLDPGDPVIGGLDPPSPSPSSQEHSE